MSNSDNRAQPVTDDMAECLRSRLLPPGALDNSLMTATSSVDRRRDPPTLATLSPARRHDEHGTDTDVAGGGETWRREHVRKARFRQMMSWSWISTRDREPTTEFVRPGRPRTFSMSPALDHAPMVGTVVCCARTAGPCWDAPAPPGGRHPCAAWWW
jgi:hypothetical protein